MWLPSQPKIPQLRLKMHRERVCEAVQITNPEIYMVGLFKLNKLQAVSLLTRRTPSFSISELDRRLQHFGIWRNQIRLLLFRRMEQQMTLRRMVRQCRLTKMSNQFFPRVLSDQISMTLN